VLPGAVIPCAMAADAASAVWPRKASPLAVGYPAVVACSPSPLLNRRWKVELFEQIRREYERRQTVLRSALSPRRSRLFTFQQAGPIQTIEWGQLGIPFTAVGADSGLVGRSPWTARAPALHDFVGDIAGAESRGYPLGANSDRRHHSALQVSFRPFPASVSRTLRRTMKPSMRVVPRARR
jgi:hypothetical protein